MEELPSSFRSRSVLSPLCQLEFSLRPMAKSPWKSPWLTACAFGSLPGSPIAVNSPVPAIVPKKRLQLSTPVYTTSSPMRTTTGSVLRLRCSPCPTRPFPHTPGEHIVRRSDQELLPSSENLRPSKRCKLPTSPRLSLNEVQSSPVGSFPVPGTMPQTIKPSDCKGGTTLWLDFAHEPPSCTLETTLTRDRELLRLGMSIAADRRTHCKGDSED